jgi:Rnl2 family RNA ligase
MIFTQDMIISHDCDFIMTDGIPENAKCRICGKGITEGVILPDPEPEKPLEFKKYRSIHNTSLESVIDRVELEGYANMAWVATNKIHGSNFSLMASADSIIPCTKEGIMPEKHSHYGHELMMPYLTRIIREMQSYFGKNIQVYFELFGGSYPHENVTVDKRFSRVMKGVWYCPSIDVRVIDIKVDGIFLDFDEMVEITERYNLMPSKAMHRGSFYDMIQLDPEFEDPTYKEYNLPKIEGNISEGYVLRPVKELMFNNGRRVILKQKSKKFSEKKNRPRKVRSAVVLNEAERKAFDNLNACVTENRLNNILSHGDTFTEKDFHKLMGLMIQDIFKEESSEAYVQNLEKLEKKRVNRLLQKEVANLIRPVFNEIYQF